MIKGTIYALAEPNTRDIRYCGKTIKLLRDRMYAHKRDAYAFRHRHLCNWLRTIYDRDENPEVIVCEELDLSGMARKQQLEVLNKAEQAWIFQLKLLGCRLTNATNGGDGCHGRFVSEETRRKMSEGNRRRPVTDKMVKRLREMAAARTDECYVRGESHPHHGKAYTEMFKDPEARNQKIKEFWSNPDNQAAHSKRMKGRMSPEERVKQSLRHRGNKRRAKLTPEQVEEIRNSTGSQRAVAARYGVCHETVGMIRRGESWKT